MHAELTVYMYAPQMALRFGQRLALVFMHNKSRYGSLVKPENDSNRSRLIAVKVIF